MTWAQAASFATIFSSMQSQLEFLTLTGVIFNALMQGYICANSIYVYLIQNIENEPLDLSHSAFAQTVIHDTDQTPSSSSSAVSDAESGAGRMAFSRTPPSVREDNNGAFGSLVQDVKESLSGNADSHANDRDKKLQEVMHQGQSFHQARLHSVLTGIADCKRKQAKLNFKMANILEEQRRIR